MEETDCVCTGRTASDKSEYTNNEQVRSQHIVKWEHICSKPYWLEYPITVVMTDYTEDEA